MGSDWSSPRLVSPKLGHLVRIKNKERICHVKSKMKIGNKGIYQVKMETRDDMGTKIEELPLQWTLL